MQFLSHVSEILPLVNHLMCLKNLVLIWVWQLQYTALILLADTYTNVARHCLCCARAQLLSNWQTYPVGEKNSCHDFSFEMNSVILLLSFTLGSLSFAFIASTFWAVAILLSYFHSCHIIRTTNWPIHCCFVGLVDIGKWEVIYTVVQLAWHMWGPLHVTWNEHHSECNLTALWSS